jgi:hypothetical protein
VVLQLEEVAPKGVGEVAMDLVDADVAGKEDVDEFGEEDPISTDLEKVVFAVVEGQWEQVSHSGDIGQKGIDVLDDAFCVRGSGIKSGGAVIVLNR